MSAAPGRAPDGGAGQGVRGRFTRWLVTVALLTAAGGALGHLFGRTLRRVSWDYLVLPADYLSLGLRLGLLAGAVVAAVQVVGPRPLPRLRWTVLAVAVLGLVSVAALGAGGWLSVLIFEGGGMGAEWELANPSRHALYLGLDAGARYGPLAGTAAAAVLLWRARRRAGAAP